MPSLTITRDQIAADVRPGDRIVAIDGHQLPRQHIVAAEPRTQGVALVNRLGTDTTWTLYPDTQVDDAITVERDDPASAPQPTPAKVRRTVTRTVAGIRLTMPPDGAEWFTEDGRYRIWLNGPYFTFCENAHPVRFTRALRDEARTRSEWFMSYYGMDAWSRARTGAAGYLCPGNAEHTYERWCIADTTTDDYAEDSEGPGGYDTFTAAARALADIIRRNA